MLKITNVSKIYLDKSKEKKEILKNVDFEINKGDFIALIGENGCGKSTLVKCMCGVLKPTEGSIKFNNVNVFKKRKDIIEKIGVVFNQKPSFMVDLSVRNNFDFLKTIYKVPNDVFKERMDFIDKHLNIYELYDSQYRKLSFGQRVRCEISSVLFYNPELIILDEPTIGLDANSQLGLYELLKYHNKVNKATIIIVTHDFKYIEKYCNRGIIMKHGQIVKDHEINKIMKNESEYRNYVIHYNFIKQNSLIKQLQDLGGTIEEKTQTIKINVLQENETEILKMLSECVQIRTMETSEVFNLLE